MSIHKQVERLKRFYEALRRGGMTGRQFRELGPYSPAGYNANSFWGFTQVEQVQHAVDAAHADGAKWVFLPEYMSGVNLNEVTVPGDVTIIHEGDFGDLITIVNNIINIGDTLTDLQRNMKKWIEWRTKPQKGVADGDGITISTLEGYTRFASDSVVGQAPGVTWKPAASLLDQLFFKIQDGRKCFMIKPGTLMQANNAVRMEWRPRNLAEPDMPYMLDFRESFGPTTSTVDGSLVPGLHATSISAWLRKEASGSATHARVGFGFCDHAVTYPSKEVSRIGLIGDGVTGYRFGSVNCPDGAASGDNAATDIDANSVSPAELVNPAANWFHVEIKLVPPTPTQTGRWYGKLNGVTVATFTTNTNFPRGSAATNRNYVGIIPMICAYPDTTQIPGLIVDDLRITFDEDLT